MNATIREAETANGWKQIRSLQFPDIERHDYDDYVSFCGTRDALRSSGLVPNGTMFPDECNAKRGVRWRSSTGRRFVLSKGWGPTGTFRLTIFATPVEKRQMSNARRVAIEVEAIDRSLRSMDISEQEFRESMRRFIPAGWRAVRDQGTLQETWEYSPEVMSALQDRFNDIHALLTTGEVVRKPDSVNALKARKAALQDGRLQSWIASLHA